jgi:DNA-binding NtrC family response regulator
MNENILIVEDEFIVANDLRIMLQKAGYKICGIAPSVAKAMALIKAKSPDWVLLDIFLQGDKTGIDLAGYLMEVKVPFIYISANTNQGILEAAKATQPYGFLVKPFREKDLLIMLDIAQYRHDQSLKYNHQNDSDFHKQIEFIISEKGDKQNKLKQMAASLQGIVPFDYLNISKADATDSSEDVILIKTRVNAYQIFTHNELLSEVSVTQREFRSWKTSGKNVSGEALYNSYKFRQLRMDSPWLKTLSDHYHFESALMIESEVINGYQYQFSFLNKATDVYTQIHVDLLNNAHKQLSLIIKDIILNTELNAVTEAPVNKYRSAPAQVPAQTTDYHGIIGHSPLLLDVFNKIELSAPDDTSILILGESGTGKERIAQTIHKLSPRKLKPMITVNCAALPINLIESELFGHEKGAFTGAHDKRIGKFEQADGGSIFLDEIGELPLEAQVKLLRVLQEKEIERLGGTYTKKINVRIITATNRNLEKEVAEGRFRLDLYYRLNVFPIVLPALRQRKEDIGLLAYYFLRKYAKKSNRNINNISGEVMEELMAYDWPGNIRELEHLIERSILLTQGDEITNIEIPSYSSMQQYIGDDNLRIKTMEEMERDHILSILKMCKGKVFGPGGAAEILNIPSTTLNSKIKKLGIKYEYSK